jgi:hypothetical protein
MFLNSASQLTANYAIDFKESQEMQAKINVTSAQSDADHNAHNYNSYYLDYDPMMGARIAVSLAGLILLFALFLIYKSHCNSRKAKRMLNYRASHVIKKRSSTDLCEE